MAESLLSRSELCERVAEALGRPFRWWNLRFLMESGALADDFLRVGGRRVFQRTDVAKVLRAAQDAKKGAVTEAVGSNQIDPERGTRETGKDEVHHDALNTGASRWERS